ncbi:MULTISPECIES: hypothetical protein [Pseudomonas]|uniref:Uncharacterized protein n=1 Tax=Pseudomonas fluorescens TaxID=294 RepID=A0A0F4TKH5_PSEFL|nr:MULTISPECIES: hypothetical protein [Pseudomonas]KJZ44918.1 hypothetical protein VC35_15810 [Pseudomonas fluorescens]MBI3908106.1 hypothetical protein [Pseudomonas fluorescens]
MDSKLERLLAATKQKLYPVPPGTFRWRFNTEPAWIEATTASLQRIRFNGRDFWAWNASTGSNNTGDIFLYDFTLDYIDENIIDKTFNLGEQGLTFTHCYMTSDGHFKCIDALSAKVSIKLDPKDGISTGDFEATFSPEFESPNGVFNLTRQTS